MSIHKASVPSEGPKDAKLVIVGEYPAASDAIHGRPFMGSVGAEFNKWLLAAGIRREDVYITHAVKYFPKGKAFFENGVPTSFYMEGIIELVKELNEIRNNGGANAVIAVGEYALWALTQKSSITKHRGSVLPSTLIKGMKVIPVLSPTFVSRGQHNKRPLCEWDLRKAKWQARLPEYFPPEAEFVVNPSDDTILEAVEYFVTKADHITFDTEWFSPNDLAYIGFTDRNDYAITIPFASMQALNAYKDILGSDVPKWGQNLMFDVPALYRVGIDVKNVQHDTMIAFNVCWGDLGEKGLNTLASIYTDWPYYKDDLDFVTKDLTSEKGQEYCGTDCVVTNEVMEKILEDEFPYLKCKKGYDISMSIFDTFVRASNVGLKVDRDKLLQEQKKRLNKADEIEAMLSDMVGYEFNTRSPTQVAKLVYDDLGLGKRRKKRSTAQDVLMDIAASSSDPEIKTILTAIIRVRQNRNDVSRYFNENVIDVDGRTRTNWNLAGTRNGRLSATKPWWNGVAMQTMPDAAREYCIADDGQIFVGWDLEQAEARVVAVLTNDWELLDDMEAGADIHTKLAAMLPFGMTYEELMELIEEKGKDNVPQRYISKKCRHSLNYVGTYYTLKNSINKEYLDTGIGISVAEAKKIVNAYYDLHTNLQEWWDKVKYKVNRTGVLVNCHGRKRRFLGVKNDHLYRDAVAFEPQSTIADTTTISIAEIDRYLEYGKRGQVMTHMHDGGFVQVPIEMADEVARKIKELTTRRLIINRQELIVPSEIKIGYDWLNMKYVDV